MAGEVRHELETAAMAVVQRPAWRVRLGARTPRLIAGVLAIVLIAAGLRATLAGPTTAPTHGEQPAAMDIGALAFGEAFTRAYLTWNPEAPERQQEAVARFVVDGLDAGAGVDQRDVQSVVWASASGVQRRGRTAMVSVEAVTDRGAYNLVIPVDRDGRGRLAVVGYPAVVGGAATSLERELPDRAEVEGAELRAVAARAVRNYLSAERLNLLADLDPEAVVSLPERELEVQSIDDISWSRRPRTVAVRASVADGSTALTLTYELEVVRRDRWYVRSIATDPTNPPPRRTR